MVTAAGNLYYNGRHNPTNDSWHGANAAVPLLQSTWHSITFVGYQHFEWQNNLWVRLYYVDNWFYLVVERFYVKWRKRLCFRQSCWITNYNFTVTNWNIVRRVNNIITKVKNVSDTLISIFHKINTLCDDETAEKPIEDVHSNTRSFITVAEAIH